MTANFYTFVVLQHHATHPKNDHIPRATDTFQTFCIQNRSQNWCKNRCHFLNRNLSVMLEVLIHRPKSDSQFLHTCHPSASCCPPKNDHIPRAKAMLTSEYERRSTHDETGWRWQWRFLFFTKPSFVSIAVNLNRHKNPTSWTRFSFLFDHLRTRVSFLISFLLTLNQ